VRRYDFDDSRLHDGQTIHFLEEVLHFALAAGFRWLRVERRGLWRIDCVRARSENELPLNLTEFRNSPLITTFAIDSKFSKRHRRLRYFNVYGPRESQKARWRRWCINSIGTQNQ